MTWHHDYSLNDIAKYRFLANSISYGFSFLLIFPLVQGVYIGWNTRNFHIRRRTMISLVILFNFLGAGLILKEGAICLFMEAPLYAVLMLIGTWIAKLIIKHTNSKKIYVSVFPLVMFAVIADTSAPAQIFLTPSVMP